MADILEIPVTLDDSIRIYHVEKLPQKMINALRDVGRWNNPDYYKKKNMGFWVHNMPKQVTARKLVIENDGSRTLIYERGLWSDIKAAISKSSDMNTRLAVHNELVSFDIEYPDFKLELEDYQKEDYEKLINGPSQGIISYPTGGGKTIIAAALIGAIHQRTLICVHTVDLMNQWVKVLRDKCYGEDLDIGIVGHGKDQVDAKHVVVGTVQSLKKYIDTAWFRASFGCIILDECHHVSAPTFIDVVGKSKAKYRYGLSATLKRQDGKDFLLNAVFGNTLVELTYKDIESRVELPVVHKIEYSTDMKIPMDIYSTRGEQEFLDTVNLHKFLAKDTDRLFLVIELAKRLIKEGDSILILVKLREHAEMLYDFLIRGNKNKIGLLMGGAASKKKQDEKNRIIKEANEGKIRCIIGTSIADEGLDIARLNVLIMAAPSSFDGLIKQRMGRIIRRHPDKNRSPAIYDIVDTQIPEMIEFWKKREKLYRSLDIEIKE